MYNDTSSLGIRDGDIWANEIQRFTSTNPHFVKTPLSHHLPTSPTRHHKQKEMYLY